MKGLRFKYLMLYCGVFLLLVVVIISQIKTTNLTEIARLTTDKIGVQFDKLKAKSDLVANTPAIKLTEEFSANGIGLYAYKNNKLVFWNNSQIPVPDKLNAEHKKAFLTLRNGYYLSYFKHSDSVDVLAISQIKYNYDLQNEYLENKFAKWLNLPNNLNLSVKNIGQGNVTLNNTFLFSLKGDDAAYLNYFAIHLLTALFFFALICFKLYSLVQLNHKPFSVYNLAFVILLIILRLSMLLFKWPNFIYLSDLYNYRIFGNAQSFFNSYLGDLILNSVMLLWLSVLFYYYTKLITKQTIKTILLGASVLLLFLNLGFHYYAFESLISNSILSFDFLNLFQLTWHSFVALIPIVFINISVLILLLSLIKNIKLNNQQNILVYFTITGLLSIAITFAFPYNYWVAKWWFFPVSTLAFILSYFKVEKNILSLGVLLLVMALISSSVLNFYISKNQKQDFQVISDNLIERQDPVLENEFYNLSEKISNNAQLNNLSQFVAYNGDKEFLQLLKQNFFFGYFDRYNIEFSMFDDDCTPLIKNTQAILLNEGFFEEQINYQSQKTTSKNLFFIDQYKDNSRYIARISLGKNKLYILLEPKFFAEVGAFPDLLIDESQQKQNKLRYLSYAVYRSDINNSMYGEYNYPVTLNDSAKFFVNQNIYTHHFFHPEQNSIVVITTKTKNLSYYFSFNSYLFLFFSLFAYLAYIFYSAFFTNQLLSSSLTRRIQSTVILLLLLSITAVGITSSTLVSNQFDKDNEKQLHEKSNTILSDLSGLLQNSDTLTDVTKELIDLTIKKFAYEFNSEISVFDAEGKLYITSQPRLYDLGLTAPFINADAFYYLKNDIVSSFSSNDKAGNLNYLSLYAPIYNSNKKLLGYLNLPYFGKQSELINELSGIISTLINVYVILFIISILSGLILAGYITLPLRMLKLKMAQVSLGAKNEEIKWESNDEVGKLVEEYNSMIEKLDSSAELLAKSERETAWREMAKQVAHEIKNPLTPMKLNLQYLQHVMKNNPTDFEERFTKASANIIAQIDALANIATEFSNFAKLPTGEFGKINLAEIIFSTVSLFTTEGKTDISCNLHSESLDILADKEQMLRVFNNLLKNAIQATSDTLNSKVTITSKEADNTILIMVRDNGCGIPEELHQNIFTPNFTTKSTGSGLGLAMIKNIFENIHAKIWFESEQNKGTVFYLEFEKANS